MAIQSEQLAEVTEWRGAGWASLLSVVKEVGWLLAALALGYCRHNRGDH